MRCDAWTCVCRLRARHWNSLRSSVGGSGADVRCCSRPLGGRGGANQWKASEPLVTDEEPLARQPVLCYAENDPVLPFFEQNRLYFIILLPSFLSARGSHLAMFDGASVFVCAWREAGVVSRLNSWAVWKGSLSLGLNLMRWSMTLKISHSLPGERKEWGSRRLNRFTAIVCQLWSPFENVNCFWDMKSFFLIAEGWVSFHVAQADRSRSRILFQVSFCIRWDSGQR